MSDGIVSDPKLKALDAPALVEYVRKRATTIARQTPQEDDAAWDDTEEWLVDAAELAHAVLELLTRGGAIRPAELP